MKYDIFISYRRFDSQGRTSGRDIARTIKLELEKRNYKVFFDYSEVRDDEFESTIVPAIGKSKYFLLVLTQEALDRCQNEGDWVRKEITHALQNGCKIIPVSPDGQFSGWPSTLPQEICSIKGIQISDVALGSLFEKSIDKLIEDRFTQKQAFAPSNRIANPFVNTCFAVQAMLYLLFCATALWLCINCSAAFNATGGFLLLLLCCSLAASLAATWFLYKRKKWAFGAILLLDILSMILLTTISTQMTARGFGHGNARMLLTQLYGYGRSLKYGTGFLSLAGTFCAVLAHSAVTCLVLQAKDKGQRIWKSLE